MVAYIPTEEELYRNNNIKINFEVPALLQQLIEQLDDLYEKKDDLNYNLLLNDLNAYAKSYFLSGKISERRYHILLDRIWSMVVRGVQNDKNTRFF